MLVELQFGTDKSYIINQDWLKVYARQVVNLQHPTLLRVFDVCLDDQDRWVLVRQALAGRWRWPLWDRGVIGNRNEVETIASILLSVSAALSHLHQAQFRGNNYSAWSESARITASANGELHFGLAPPNPVEAYPNPEPVYMGALIYSAPEAFDLPTPDVALYRPTPASDSFSLGSLLFTLLTDQPLVRQSGTEAIVRELNAGHFPSVRDIRRDLPMRLADFVNRALAKSPEARPSLKEWGFMMEELGGRLLMPPTSSAVAPASDETSQRSTLNLVSVLNDESRNRQIAVLAPLGRGGMGGEYLGEISIDEPEVNEPASAETVFAGPADEDEIPTKPLSPPASVNTGALPADFNPRGPASVHTGALPADFVTEPDKPLYLDENVQFTLYRPKAIVPQKWYSLLAFAHLSEKREDAPEDEPDPVAEVRQQAQRILGEQADEYQNLTQDTLQAIPREGTITFLPTMPGVEFNPASRSFTWEESVHREDFRLRARQSGHGGRVLKGRLSVFLGSILLADIPLSIRVDSHETSKKQKKPLEEVHARPYRKIFASYSHRDIEVVEQFERFAEAMGDRYLRDVTYLRSGELWGNKLEEMIVEADIFQLFWSSNSMTSPFVRQEWEYALSLQRPNFIRPTYWEEPLPVKPDQKLPPEELMRLHFQRIRSSYDSRSRAASPTQGVTPIAAAPEDTEVRQSAVRDSQSSGRSQSVDRRADSRDSSRGEAPASGGRRSASRGSEQRPEIAPDPRLAASKESHERASLLRSNEEFKAISQLYESPKSSDGIGSSGRRGVGGSDPSDSVSTISSHRPPAAAPPPTVLMSQSPSPQIQYSSRSGAGGKGAFGELLAAQDRPAGGRRLIIPIAIIVLGIIAVLIYFLMR